MTPRILPGLLLSLISTAIGLLCGWFGARHGHPVQTAPAEPPAVAAGALALPPETLRNLGVQTTEARLETFRLHRPVAAVVAALPTARQPVAAPVAGRVRSVEAVLGARTEPGQALVTLVRDPLPRVALTLTGDVLGPLREGLHETMAMLRRAMVSLEILRKEKERLEASGKTEEGLPILPGKDLIRIEYELTQAESEKRLIENELERHGLSPDQIREVESGRHPSIDAQTWLRALKQSGLWTSQAQELFSVLPASIRESPWTVATIAELMAGDLVPGRFAAWLESDETAARRFLEIGGLLQNGYVLAAIQELQTLGALEDVVVIRAPSGAPDWDVQALSIRPGAQVRAGETLLVLEDPRHIFLRGEPMESEIALALEAVQAGTELEASPIVAGSAPELAGLAIRQVLHSATDSRTSLFIPLANKPLEARTVAEGLRFRSW